jgi:hypothetical protein
MRGFFYLKKGSSIMALFNHGYGLFTIAQEM